jgi:hypothetical protein
MTWCETNGVDYIFALPGNVVLDRFVEPAADETPTRPQRPRPYQSAEAGARRTNQLVSQKNSLQIMRSGA